MPFEFTWESGHDLRLLAEMPPFLVGIPEQKELGIVGGYYTKEELCNLLDECAGNVAAIKHISKCIRKDFR